MRESASPHNARVDVESAREVLMFVSLPGWLLSSGALPGCAWMSFAGTCAWFVVWGALGAAFAMLLRPAAKRI